MIKIHPNWKYQIRSLDKLKTALSTAESELNVKIRTLERANRPETKNEEFDKLKIFHRRLKFFEKAIEELKMAEAN